MRREEALLYFSLSRCKLVRVQVVALEGGGDARIATAMHERREREKVLCYERKTRKTSVGCGSKQAKNSRRQRPRDPLCTPPSP